jgi:hypothetical protein
MKITKPKKLTKKTLAPPPIEWREPFDDYGSPLRITFSDSDLSRNGMKFVLIQKVDGSLAQHVVEETMADALAGNPTERMISDFRDHLERSQEMSDREIAAHLKDAAEEAVSGILYVDATPIGRAHSDDPATQDVVCLCLSYLRTVMLLLWLKRNPEFSGHFDADADWNISGYELFHAGMLDQQCGFTPGTWNPTPEEVEQFPDIFVGRDRMPQGESADKIEANARHLVLSYYLDRLQEVADHPPTDAPPWFALCLAHHILFTERWFANQMAAAISRETGEPAHLVKINTDTGQVQSILGGEEAADHLVAMGSEYFGALTEGRVQKRPEGVQ